ncbi:MAG: tetratricopeptide repeat protein [Deltaproteobacteria bacterium]|nr:tetratricopeptide repeat protein [Deltaproteobacteria bacterium]
MSSIYDALQRIQEQKDLISSKGARSESLQRRTILRLIVLSVVISSVSTAGIFYGIRILKDGNEVVENVSMPKESSGYEEAASYVERREEMRGNENAGVENKQDIEVVISEPDNIETYMKLGGRYYESGDYDKALLAYTSALQYFQGDARLLNNIGIVLLAKGEREKAIEYFTQADAVSEDFVEPVYNMACTYAIMGDQARALSALKKAHALNPQVVQWAAEDPDLRSLEGIAEFEAIIHEQ